MGTDVKRLALSCLLWRQQCLSTFRDFFPPSHVFFFKMYFYPFKLQLHVCTYVFMRNVCSNRRSEESTDSVGLQSEAAVSHLTGMMETELQSFGRAVNTFSGLAMGSATKGCIL